MAQWLERTEALWEKHKQSTMTHLERIDYHGALSCQFPIEPVRVVYVKAGTKLAAALVRDEDMVVEHTLYWAAVKRLDEARYLCGILNSETLRKGVASYQAQGQWGARHFDKYVFNMPIPPYDGTNTLHCCLSEAAKTAENVARLVSAEEGEYFTRTRRRIRAALSEHGIADTIESLVTELLE